MAWISLSQKEEVIPRDPPDASLYDVTFRVVATGDIAPEIFVLDVATDTYQHVALVADMLSWPPSRSEALDAYKPYYRAPEFTRSFDNKGQASAFAAVTRARVDILTRLWATSTNTTFGGETAYVYNSESP